MSCSLSGNGTSRALAGSGDGVNYVFGVTVDPDNGNINLGHLAEGSIGLTTTGIIDRLTGSTQDSVKAVTYLPEPRQLSGLDSVISAMESEFQSTVDQVFSSMGLPASPSVRDLRSNLSIGQARVSRTMNLKTEFKLPAVGTFAEQGSERVEDNQNIPFQPILVPDRQVVRDAVNNLGTVTFRSTLKSTDLFRNVGTEILGGTIEISHEVDMSCFFRFMGVGNLERPGRRELPERPDTGTCLDEYPTINERIEEFEERARNADPKEALDLVDDVGSYRSEIRTRVEDDPCLNEFRSRLDSARSRLRSIVSELDCADVSGDIKARRDDLDGRISSLREISPLNRERKDREDIIREAESLMNDVEEEVADENPCKDQIKAQVENIMSEIDRIRIFEEEDFECASRYPDANSLLEDYETRTEDITSSIEEEEFRELMDFEGDVQNAIEQVEDGPCRREFLRRLENVDRLVNRVVSPARVAQETISEAESRRQDLISQINTQVESTNEFLERASGDNFLDQPSPGEEPPTELDSIIRETAENPDGSTVTMNIPVREVVREVETVEEVDKELLDKYAPIDEVRDEIERDRLVNRVRESLEGYLPDF